MAEAAPDDARFAACLAETLRQEGGFVDHPLDPGGATNMGITRRTLATSRGVSPWWKLPVADVRKLAEPEAASIYRARYWQPCRGDALPPGLDLAVFDYAVNSGPDRAIQALQRALGVTADGRIGPQTLGALQAKIALRGAADLIVALCNGRLSFLDQLTLSATFGAGWRHRVDLIRAAALKMAGVTALTPQKGNTVNLNILAGYKTYIVGAAMLIVGIAQLLGVSIPDFSGQSAGDLLMQGLGIIFLRQGITNTVAKS